MKIIFLNHNKETKVDDEDYKDLILYKWRFNTTGYATRTYKSISMHRQIMKAKKGQYVDHINGDKLDNRKSNLRIVTNQENCWSKKIQKPVGVCQTKHGSWRAYCTNNGKQKSLKYWKTKEEAMKSYDSYVLKTRGKFAVTNKMLGFY